MQRIILFLFAISTAACDCLPNPQSEWVTSEGGEQRSTVTDRTFTPPNADSCECNEWHSGWHHHRY